MSLERPTPPGSPGSATPPSPEWPDLVAMPGEVPVNDLGTTRPEHLTSSQWAGLIAAQVTARSGADAPAPPAANGPGRAATAAEAAGAPGSAVAGRPGETSARPVGRSAPRPYNEGPVPDHEALIRHPGPPQHPIVLAKAFARMVTDADGQPAVVVALPGLILRAAQAWVRTTGGMRSALTVVVAALVGVAGVGLAALVNPVDRVLNCPIEVSTSRAPLDAVLREHRVALLGEELRGALDAGGRGDQATQAWRALRDQAALAGCTVSIEERTTPAPVLIMRAAGHGASDAEPALRALADAYRRWQTSLTAGGLAGKRQVDDRQFDRSALVFQLEKLQAELRSTGEGLQAAQRAAATAAKERAAVERAAQGFAAEYDAHRARLDNLLAGKGQVDFSPSAAELAAARAQDAAIQRVEQQLAAAQRDHRRLLREAMAGALEGQQAVLDRLRELGVAIAQVNSKDLPADLSAGLQALSADQLDWQLATLRLMAAWKPLAATLASAEGGADVTALQAAADQAADVYLLQAADAVDGVQAKLRALAAGGANMAVRMSVNATLAGKFEPLRLSAETLASRLRMTRPEASGLLVNLQLQNAVNRARTAAKELSTMERSLRTGLAARNQAQFEQDREGQLRKAKADLDRAYARVQQTQADLAKAQEQQAALEVEASRWQARQDGQDELRRQISGRIATLDDLIARLSREASLSADRVEVGPIALATNADQEVKRTFWMLVLAVVGLGLGVLGMKGWDRAARNLVAGPVAVPG